MQNKNTDKDTKKEIYTSEQDIQALIDGDYAVPSYLLGQHTITINEKQAVIIRGFFPYAREISVVPESGRAVKMTKIHNDGFYIAVFKNRKPDFHYKYRVKTDSGKTEEFEDSYKFHPLLTDFDLHLLTEGTHYKSYEKLGAHPEDIEGVKGVLFAVWAPNAGRVSVVGDFNKWDGRVNPMNNTGNSGIWELFIPGLSEGINYKYEIKSRDSGQILLKTDPYSFFCEHPPKTASVVHDIEGYKWKDTKWMEKRRETNYLEQPVSIYEVHLGSWQKVPEEDNRPLTYRELAVTLVPYVKEMGYTHIEILPVTEHPLDESWGYQTIGYFAPTSRHGEPQDFMFFIDTCHQAGIGVIMDWVPSHFPKDGHGLAFFDGTSLYEHSDPRMGEQKDWGTLVFNYGRNEVTNFLISNALFWLEKYHIDGLRMDAVASMLYLDYSRESGEWIPNRYGGNENLDAIQFIKRMNEVVHLHFPGVLTIAEESTAWPMVSRPTYLGGLGFSLKWNMGWMNDSLVYISKDPIHKKFHHGNLTFSLLYAFTENFVLVLSHDEVVHGKRTMIDKMPGDYWQKFANLRAFYGYMYGHPGKKMLFMSNEFGQWNEWWVKQSLDWHLIGFPMHNSLLHFVKDLNHVYTQESALYNCDFEHQGFEWIDFQDVNNSIIAFMRKTKDQKDFLVFVCNFTPIPRFGYRIGVPEEGFYKEILNSDSEIYGGSNLGNYGGIQSDPVPWHGKSHSINMTIPPLSTVIFKRVK